MSFISSILKDALFMIHFELTRRTSSQRIVASRIRIKISDIYIYIFFFLFFYSQRVIYFPALSFCINIAGENIQIDAQNSKINASG